MEASPGTSAGIVEVAIGALIVRHGGDARLLIARRSSSQALGGYWELPGGKREAGETLAQCLEREFLEELGLAVTVGRPLAVVEHAYDHANVRLHAFVCTPADDNESPPAPRVDSGSLPAVWVTAAELANYCFPPANDGLLEKVVAAMG